MQLTRRALLAALLALSCSPTIGRDDTPSDPQPSGSGPQSLCYVAFDGDSLTSGYGLAVFPGDDYPTKLARGQVGGLIPFGYRNVAVSGEPLQTMIANAAANVDSALPCALCYVSVLWGGKDDNSLLGLTAAQVYAEVGTYTTARQAAGWTRRVVLTVIPDGLWPSGGFDDNNRLTLNGLIVANAAHYPYDVVDVAADPRFVPQSPPVYQSDTRHLSAIGQTYIAQDLAIPTPGIIGSGILASYTPLL